MDTDTTTPATVTDTYYGRQRGDVVVLAFDVYDYGLRMAYATEEAVVAAVLESDGTAAGTRYILRPTRVRTAVYTTTADHLQEN